MSGPVCGTAVHPDGDPLTADEQAAAGGRFTERNVRIPDGGVEVL